MKARLTPQQKKLLSYAYDRRNAYGERGANSRFAISANKQHERRSLRRAGNAGLQTLAGSADEDVLLQAESAVRTGQAQPAHFVKYADAPLRDVVDYKLRRRALHRHIAAQTPVSHRQALAEAAKILATCPLRIAREDIAVGESSGGSDRCNTRLCLTFTHLPTGIQVSRALPTADYTRKRAAEARQALFVLVLADLHLALWQAQQEESALRSTRRRFRG